MGLEEAFNLSDLLNRTQSYINYEELYEEGERDRGAGNSRYSRTPKRDNVIHKEDEDRGPQS